MNGTHFIQLQKVGMDSDLYRLIMKSKIQEHNPMTKVGVTPFHLAASKGHKEICKMIMDEIEEKNPTMNIYKEIIKIMIFRLKDKNPKDGQTPTHLAARNGHETIYKMIMDEVYGKIPNENYGFTPLHVASLNDQGVQEKNSLNFGIKKVHKEIIDVIVEQYQ